MGRLDSARLKLARAIEHQVFLKEEVSGFMATKPYALSRAEHIGHGWFLVRFLVRRNPPMKWALLAGDVATNANAALDHIVYGLSRTKKRGTGFPIALDPDEYVRPKRNGSDRDRLLDGVREFPERAVIDAYQPYADRMKANPLYLLRFLANADKHRIVQPGFARPRHFRINGPPGYHVPVVPKKVVGRVKNRTELLRYTVIGPQSPSGGVKVNAEIDVSIGFGAMAIDLVELNEALARVDEVIRAF